MREFFVAERNPERCVRCGACMEIVKCSALHVGHVKTCTGCGACFLACPHGAIYMRRDRRERKHVKIRVDGESYFVPGRITVKRALEYIGYTFSKLPNEADFFAPCEVGGCYSCAVVINGELKPACVTVVRDHMDIRTDTSAQTPKRLVHGWMGHSVGGVGTPWYLKKRSGYVEAAVFSCGCNYRCPQCQNWTTTYCGRGDAISPQEAAVIMTRTRKICGVDRMAISGGESTLNRRWLIEYIRELRRLNPDRKARFHVDTNASLLTKDYIDELVESGVTDIGPDLKGYSVETFMRITGLVDRKLAEIYHKTSWDAVKYLVDNYRDKVFIGVGVPYNKDLISIEEIEKIGYRLFKIDPEIQVCVLDYRPEYRNMSLKRPSYKEMAQIWEILRDIGLKTVVCQTAFGYITPKE